MRTITVRLPEALVEEIDAEARERGVSKSDVVRERLQVVPGLHPKPASRLAAIADLVGSIDDLPADLSSRKKEYLRSTAYGRKRHR